MEHELHIVLDSDKYQTNLDNIPYRHKHRHIRVKQVYQPHQMLFFPSNSEAQFV